MNAKTIIDSSLKLNDYCYYEIEQTALISPTIRFNDCEVSTEVDLIHILYNVFKSQPEYIEDIDITKPKSYIEASFSIEATNSTFRRVALWQASHFLEGDTSVRFSSRRLSFEHCTFKEEVDFTKVILPRSTRFFNCVFEQKVSFKCVVSEEKIEFINCSFLKYTSFDGAYLQNITFDYITTHEKFEIVPASLNGKILITNPSFESDKSLVTLDFENCSACSQSSVAFKNIEVDEDRVCLKIRNLREGSNVEVHFQDCGFYGKNVSLKNITLDHLNIEGGTLAKGFDFGYLKPIKRSVILGFLGFPIKCEFDAIHKNDTIAQDRFKMWASIYANLKAKADEEGERQRGNDYFFWQQYFQRVEHHPPFCNFNEIYLCSSTYGLNVKLPLFYFSAYLLAFALFYMMTALHSFPEGCLVSLSASTPFVFNDIDTIQNAIGLIATKENWWWFYPLYILQHLIQGYLLFQIGAAIRNKVKR